MVKPHKRFMVPYYEYGRHTIYDDSLKHMVKMPQQPLIFTLYTSLRRIAGDHGCL